ncbi:DUF2062 domain-containing protein [Amphibiibacter pelophylacis]|uniref:DUF2062 domain-containing protein n=1 Tax=Amphibiibacter pelophylacis TaxID=1799477 RepID=A0ACC6NY81_9BURK
MSSRWRAWIPTPEQIRRNRWLRWLGPLLDRPELWRWSRHGVALGVSLGIFFGLLIPVAQIPLSVGASVVLRANVPAAAASTLVSNPITFAPLYYLAWRLGQRLTGGHDASPPALPDGAAAKSGSEPDPTEQGWSQRLRRVGVPLVAGLSVLATLGGLLSYGLVSLVWWGAVRWKIYRRRQRRQTSQKKSQVS